MLQHRLLKLNSTCTLCVVPVKCPLFPLYTHTHTHIFVHKDSCFTSVALFSGVSVKYFAWANCFLWKTILDYLLPLYSTSKFKSGKTSHGSSLCGTWLRTRLNLLYYYHHHHHVNDDDDDDHNPQDEVGPSISSSVVLCSFVLVVYIVKLVLVFYLCPSSVHVVATFSGTVLFTLLNEHN
jgi:hypothetical protein